MSGRLRAGARTRESATTYRSPFFTKIGAAKLRSESFLFPSRLHKSEHLSTRQYGRIVDGWAVSIGLDPSAYGTHSMRRTKASLIYRRTGNLRAVQLLLGHTKIGEYRALPRDRGR